MLLMNFQGSSSILFLEIKVLLFLDYSYFSCFATYTPIIVPDMLFRLIVNAKLDGLFLSSKSGKVSPRTTIKVFQDAGAFIIFVGVLE